MQLPSFTINWQLIGEKIWQKVGVRGAIFFGVLALSVLIGAFWYVPILHVQGAVIYHQLMGDSNLPTIVEDSPLPSGKLEPSASPVGEEVPSPATLFNQLNDQINQLQNRVLSLEKAMQETNQSTVSLQGQLKGALSQLDQSNNLLAKQQLEWQTAIRQVQSSAGISTSGGPVDGQSGESDPTQVTSQKVNINTASLLELETLPGIGESYAERIISYRQENGLFQQIEDLEKISGIKSHLFDQIKGLITV